MSYVLQDGLELSRSTREWVGRGVPDSKGRDGGVWEALGTGLGDKAGPDPRSPVGGEGEEGLAVFKS